MASSSSTTARRTNRLTSGTTTPVVDPLVAAVARDYPLSAKLAFNANLTLLHQSPLLVGRFLPLLPDHESETFLASCVSEHSRRFSWTNVMTYCVRPILRKCIGHSNLNGLLHIGQMHLLSAKQCRTLIDGLPSPATATAASAAPPSATFDDLPDLIDDASSSSSSSSTSTSTPSLSATSESKREGKAAASGTTRKADLRLLDVGAGDGRVTMQLAPCFTEVVTTELSSQMAIRLRKRGFKCYETGDVKTGVPFDGGYDVITLFNLIDRCSKPRTLLKDIREQLRDETSRLVVAVPIPLNPWVEKGTKWVLPEEDIGPRSCCQTYYHIPWEETVRNLTDGLFRDCGYNVQSVSRVPYLSQGDHTRSYYSLDDAIFVLTPSSPLRK